MTSSKELADQCLEFICQFDSVLIGTSDTTGEPDVSYSPVIYHNSRFYILVSRLSPHTGICISALPQRCYSSRMSGIQNRSTPVDG